MVGLYKSNLNLSATPKGFSVEKSIGPLLKPRIPFSLLLNISLPELRIICFQYRNLYSNLQFLIKLNENYYEL